MIFSSYKFIFIFLPIVFLVYRLLVKLKLTPISRLWLVASSFYFYAQGSIEFTPFFIGTVFFNYVIGSMIIQSESYVKKVLLIIGLIENITLLVYFKYTNFFLKNINMLTGSEITLKTIILPIGISFFTFQLIAYIVDCYRGQSKNYSILDFLLFITFFPQLIVGPIIHHHEIVPQFEDDTQPIFNKKNFALAIYVFSIGCAKKVLIADTLTTYAQPFFSNINEGTFWAAWGSSISYAFSYYFDLSGYADMAIGLGLLFNINLPQNFNSPYKARNFQDYWRRWHITLSRFLNTFVFRSVFKKGDSSQKYYLAVMITFLVSGFWHGAGWNFVAWGIINGIFVCMANYLARKRISFPFLLAWSLTMIGVIGTRILFVSPGLSAAYLVYVKMFTFSEFVDYSFLQILYSFYKYILHNLYTFVILIVSIVIAFGTRNTSQLTKDIRLNPKYAVVSAVLFVISIFNMTGVTKFLYFQF